jgi:Concanavalin A-like lectin/glucanases superfamily
MARDFDEGANYLTAPVYAPGGTTWMGDLTLACWFKLDASASAGNLDLLIDGNGANGIGFAFQNAGAIVKVLVGGTAFMGAGVTLTAGAWSHLAVVRTAAGPWQYYVNGTFREQGSPAPIAPTVGFHLGGQPTSGSVPGKLGEACLWDVGQSPAQVQALALGSPPHRVAPANLRRYLPLWGAAFPEAELSGAVANAVLTGNVPLADHPPMGPILIAA